MLMFTEVFFAIFPALNSYDTAVALTFVHYFLVLCPALLCKWLALMLEITVSPFTGCPRGFSKAPLATQNLVSYVLCRFKF